MAGETIGPYDIAAKRPGSGRAPIEYWSLIGTKTAQPYDTEDQV
jgi:N-acetylneuraminate synthase